MQSRTFHYENTMPYLTRETPSPEPIDCRILTAALDLYVSKGYHNVSIHEIQKQANVSIGSIYNHFGGKEGIAKALYDHLLNEMNEMVDSVIEQGGNSIDQCNSIIALLFEYTETRSNIIAYILHAKHGEFINDEKPMCCGEPFQRMRNIVQQGIDNGEIKSGNSWVASSSIFGPAIRLIHLRLDGVIDLLLPELYDETINSIWSGMSVQNSINQSSLSAAS